MYTFVPFSANAELAAIAHALSARTLPKREWTHAAHFAAALWLLEMGADAAMPDLIRRYNETTSVANTDNSGYHETITLASLHAARAFRAKRPGLHLFEVCNELLASRLGKPDWPLTHWSRDRLFSTEARNHWVEPDLKPLGLW
jgi:hypothetical protein